VSEIVLSGVSKTFPGGVKAVDGINLTIKDGEFMVLVGPSGCGKSTLLRLVAGLEEASQGTVAIGDTDVTTFAPRRRDIAMVFQSYALYPHMSVRQNIAYGLKVRRTPKDEAKRRVEEVAAMLGLEGLLGRRPAQLSGGQRQRVALARAIVNRPEVLLLDEPLGALDLKLRQEMQTELKRIQGEVGITFIYVTHDQEEALTMSDRIAVFSGGRIEQVGSPSDVYERPETEFVAGFVGVSNILERDGRKITVRPEKIRILSERAAEGEPGTVRDAVYVGMVTRYTVELDAGGVLQVVEQNLDTSFADVSSALGQRVRLLWSPENVFEIREGK